MRKVVLNESNKDKVLGLDCSSSTVGWGLLTIEEEPQLLAFGNFQPPKAKFPLMDRLNFCYNKTKEICEEFKPTIAAVEDIFIFFKGGSKAQTITILTAFNRVISLSAFRNTSELKLYTVHEIRKAIKEKLLLEKNPEKELIPDLIQEYLSEGFKPELNKKGFSKKESFDESDGIAVAWAHVLIGLKNRMI